MFIWATERLKIELISYECEAEGRVLDLLDRTSKFEQVILRPIIKVKAGSIGRIGKALEWARKYSLVANSITARFLLNQRLNKSHNAGALI